MDRHQGSNRGKKVRIVEKKSTGDGLSLVIISWGFIHGNAFVSVGVGGHGGGLIHDLSFAAAPAENKAAGEERLPHQTPPSVRRSLTLQTRRNKVYFPAKSTPSPKEV
jgi:hypothetical protein